jgi:hypothetical protein
VPGRHPAFQAVPPLTLRLRLFDESDRRMVGWVAVSDGANVRSNEITH